MKHSLDDTIAAIATPVGVGGVGMIRISGRRAKEALLSVFRGGESGGIESHRMMHGWIVNNTGEKVDEVLACFMGSPKSFTGEDVAEIYCHGSQVVLRSVLGLIMKHDIRLAENGEFAKRAFLSGKLDLTQAESILDLVKAKTEVGAGYAIRQLEGRLKQKIDNIKEELTGLLVEIEVGMDFPDDGQEKKCTEIHKKIRLEVNKMDKLLEKAEVRRVFRDGISVVITGKPNVGKSSLLNAILGEERVIVTDVPGTTRDTIEEGVSIRGLAVKIIDTAGIRETGGAVERAGVERARKEIKMADMVIMVFDGAAGLSAEDFEIINEVGDKLNIAVINKIDLANIIKIDEINGRIKVGGVALVSAIRNEGIGYLLNIIHEMAIHELKGQADYEIAINARHEGCLQRAKIKLEKAMAGACNEIPNELITIDIKEAISELGEITGETISEEIVNKIFSDFCIGK